MPSVHAGFLSQWAAPMALVFILTAGCTWQSETFYSNGQIMVVKGAQGRSGEREGVWCHFNPDGSVMLNEQTEYGLMDRTGYYEHGKKIRELTPTELERSRLRAEKLMQENRVR